MKEALILTVVILGLAGVSYYLRERWTPVKRIYLHSNPYFCFTKMEQWSKRIRLDYNPDGCKCKLFKRIWL